MSNENSNIDETPRLPSAKASPEPELPKARFDDYYAIYSPIPYVEDIVRGLEYDIPFSLMDALSEEIGFFLRGKGIRVTFVGSCHGLEAMVLKYGLLKADIITRWSDETAAFERLPSPESGLEATLVDSEPEPLRFARTIGLADETHVVDLTKPYPPALEERLRTKTDLIVACGILPYIGAKGLHLMLDAAFVKGSARYLCFSMPNYLNENEIVSTCEQAGLTLKKMGVFRQRKYRDPAESSRITKLLAKAGRLFQEDHVYMRSAAFMACR